MEYYINEAGTLKNSKDSLKDVLLIYEGKCTGLKKNEFVLFTKMKHCNEQIVNLEIQIECSSTEKVLLM